MENCHGCDSWICEDCAEEYDGYFFCTACFAEMVGELNDGFHEESVDDDDLDYDDDSEDEDEGNADDD